MVERRQATQREGHFRKGGETGDRRAGHAKGKREGSARTCQRGTTKGNGREYGVPEGGIEPDGQDSGDGRHHLQR